MRPFRDLHRYAKKVKLGIDQIHRGVTIELFSSVVMSTPVDEGRARGNWQITLDVPARGESGTVDPSGAQVVNEITATATGGRTNYLTNNLPYIQRLEFGAWSQQAPAGMVRINLARVERLLREQVREAGG